MATKESLLVEIDGEHNEAHLFEPVKRVLRGRFSFRRAGPEAASVGAGWPSDEIPGQMIEVNSEDGVGAIVDPLHLDEHRLIREHIERRGQRLPPAREEHRGIDVQAWLAWLRNAIECGVARVVRGRMPENVARPKSGQPADDGLARENQALREQMAELRGEMSAIRAMLAGKK